MSLRDRSAARPAVRTVLVDFERPLLRIPNLAIHLQRELAQEGLKLNAQKHLAPVLGLEEVPAARRAARQRAPRAPATAGAEAADVLGFDLMALRRAARRRGRRARRVRLRAAPRQPGLLPRRA